MERRHLVERKHLCIYREAQEHRTADLGEVEGVIYERRKRKALGELRAMKYKLLRCITSIRSALEISKVMHPILKIFACFELQPNYCSQYNSEEKSTERLGYWNRRYPDLVESHVFLQTGDIEKLTAPHAAFDTPKLQAGGCPLKKLILPGQPECYKEEDPKEAVTSKKDLRTVMNGQAMRPYFNGDSAF